MRADEDADEEEEEKEAYPSVTGPAILLIFCPRGIY